MSELDASTETLVLHSVDRDQPRIGQAREGEINEPVLDGLGQRRLLRLRVLLVLPLLTLRAVLSGAGSGDDGRHGADAAAVLDRRFRLAELLDKVSKLSRHVSAVLQQIGRESS